MPLTDIFKRKSRRDAQIDAAVETAYTGKPPKVVAPVKRDAVAEMDAAQAKAWGPPKKNTRAKPYK